MLDERLNILAVISIESDILRQLKYEDIIKDFTIIKSIRKQLSHYAIYVPNWLILLF